MLLIDKVNIVEVIFKKECKKMNNNETNEEKTKRLKNINYILDECYEIGRAHV